MSKSRKTNTTAIDFKLEYETCRKKYQETKDQAEFIQALENLKKHAADSKDRAWSLWFRARLLDEKNHLDEALKVYEQICDVADDAIKVIKSPYLWALLKKGYYLGELGRTEEAIAVYDDLVEKYQDRPEVQIAEQVASALFNKGVHLGALGRTAEAIAVYDDLITKYQGRPEVEIMEKVAKALFNKGGRLGALGRTEEAIAVYNDLITKYKGRPEVEIMENVASAMFNKGGRLGALGRTEEEIAVYDDLVTKCRNRPEVEIMEQVVKALFNKGVRLGALGRTAEAIAVYDDLITKYHDRPEVEIMEKVAKALFNKSGCLGALDRTEEAIAVYDDLVTKYRDRPEVEIMEKVASTLLNKGVRLGALGRTEEAIAVYDHLVEKYQDRPEVQITMRVAKALVNKGLRLDELGWTEEAIVVYDDLVKKYQGRPEVEIIEQVASALFNKGFLLDAIGRTEEAIVVYDHLVKKYQDRPEVQIAEPVASALVNKGFRLGALGRTEEAIAVNDHLVEKYQDRPEVQIAEQVAIALVNKGVSLGAIGRTEKAGEVFDLVLRRFETRSEKRIQELVTRARVLKFHVLRKSQDTTSADKVLDDAREKAPDSPVVRVTDGFKNHSALVDKIEELLGKIDKDTRESFGNAIKKQTGNREKFLLGESRFNDEISFFLVLREWNSYTPIIPDPQETVRGGGYFLCHRGKGIVIDPGYDFIFNFWRAGGRLCDIDAIVVTHAHDDHTADFESLMTLLHLYNKRNKDRPHRVDLLLSHGAERKLCNFFRLRSDNRIRRIFVLNRCDESSMPQRITTFDGIHLTVLPAYHDDVMTLDSSVGLCFDVECGSETRRIVFTGDTGLYPKEIDDKGELKKYVANDTENDENNTMRSATSKRSAETIEWDLLDTRDEKNALYARYHAIFEKTDGENAKQIDLLIPHLGSIQEYELDNPDKSDPNKVLLYANHLGLRGMTVLLDALRPKAAVISEFGSELRNVKKQLIDCISDALKHSADGAESPFLVPGDITIVYNICHQEFLCHRSHKFQKPENLEVIEDEDADPEILQQANRHMDRIYLVRNDFKKSKQRQDLREYFQKRNDWDLPYFKTRKNPKSLS